MGYINGILISAVVLIAAFIFLPSLPSHLSGFSTKNNTVIVIGGGLAGLTAALEAHEFGAHNVYILDKESRLGGNSAKASSGINGVGTPAQLAAHSDDTQGTFLEDTLSSGGGLCVRVLVDRLVSHSTDAVAYLSSLGVDLSVLSQCGGHRYPRTHRAAPPPAGQPARNIGFEITSKLINHLNKTTPIKVLTDSRVQTILKEEGRVVGVQYSDKEGVVHELRGVVIITAGGFGADRGPGGLLEEHGGKSFANLPTTNGPWATGDGARLAQKAGARLILMDKVQIHPTGFIDPNDPTNPTKFLAPEALRAVGGILINNKGRRFVNELSLRNQVTPAIFEHGFRLGNDEKGYKVAYMLLNEEAVNAFGAAALKFYMSKGFIKNYQNVAEFASAVGVDQAMLEHTLEKYNAAKEKGGPDEFGKTTFPVAFDATKQLSVLIITPSIHYTMGGALITPTAQVVGEDGAIIPGLYAAGEASGGVHGENRLAGNSLLECTVYGRIAGKHAATVKY